MHRIIVITASLAGLDYVTRMKRRRPDSEVNLIIPAALKEFQAHYLANKDTAAQGPAAKRLAAALPDMDALRARDVGVLEALNITPDLKEREVNLRSSQGSISIRYSELVIEISATVRIPRALQAARNIFGWPLPGFAAHPHDCDKALAQAAAEQRPVIIIGNGPSALDAVFLAREAGAQAHWLYTGEQDSPPINPHMLQLIRKRLGPDLRFTPLPNTLPERLTCKLNSEGSLLEHIVLPDGTALQSPCCLWTSPLMAKHPLLREEGILLDNHGCMRLEDPSSSQGLHIMGSGVNVPTGRLPVSGLKAPFYAGGDEHAWISAILTGAATGNISPDTDLGSMAIRTASTPGLHFYRAGYGIADAQNRDLDLESAITALPDPDDASGKGLLILELVCERQSHSLIGVQVLGVDISKTAAEGLFGVALAALSADADLTTLSARPRIGLPGRLLGMGASILLNKLQTLIKGISPDELLASQDAGSNFFMLDLRPAADWKAGHLPGAHNIPMPQLKKRLQAEVPHFVPLVLLSTSGSDAFVAACKLAALGATDLYVLDGGMNLWPYELEATS